MLLRLCLLVCALAPSFAFGDGEVVVDSPGAYHNPRGSIVGTLIVGVDVGGVSTRVGVGAGVGYAVLTGVLPGVRGVLIFGDEMAGELGATLTLSPPITFFLTPFAYGEVGRRFDSSGAWIVAGGPGLYVGDPRDTFVLQAGWIFRRYLYEVGGVDGSGPLLALNVKF